MADKFALTGRGMLDPWSYAEAVTPSDTVDLSGTARGLYIGTGGDVRLLLEGNTAPVTFVAVPSGSLMPVRATRVYATGTTADDIILGY